MTEAGFHRELVCSHNLESNYDPLSQLLYAQALEQCRIYVTANPNPELEKLLPDGWRRIPKEIQNA